MNTDLSRTVCFDLINGIDRSRIVSQNICVRRRINLFSARSWAQWYLVCNGFPKVKACDGSLVPVNHYYGRVECNDLASEKFRAVL